MLALIEKGACHYFTRISKSCLPLVQQNSDDYADDEDYSQDRPYHPDQAFLFVDDRLGVDIGRNHRVGVRTCGVHGLQDDIHTRGFKWTSILWFQPYLFNHVEMKVDEMEKIYTSLWGCYLPSETCFHFLINSVTVLDG